MIKQGGKVWNKWRELDADERPDLAGADLSGTILSGRPYKYGKITWTSGANLGLVYEIGDYTTNIAPLGSTGQFTTRTEMENVVQIGDGCTIEEGCDNTFLTCKAVYGNSLNFGGWNLIPGPTRARQSPRRTW